MSEILFAVFAIIPAISVVGLASMGFISSLRAGSNL